MHGRLRTLALCVCASGVVGYGLYTLRATLVPLVLAIALTYLLQPLIDLLSVRPMSCCGVTLCSRPPEQLRTASPRMKPFVQCIFQCKLPRWLAVCVALLCAFAVLALLGFIVADSIHIFTQRAAVYSERVQELCMGAIATIDRLRAQLADNFGPVNGTAYSQSGTASASAGGSTVNATADEERAAAQAAQLARLAGRLPVSELIMHSLSSMIEALSNLPPLVCPPHLTALDATWQV